MRFPHASRRTFRLQFGVAAFVWLSAALSSVSQPIQFGLDRTPSAELSAPQVNVVSGPTASRLEQARALAANEDWEDAIDVLQQLAVEESDEVVEVADGRFVRLRTYCHLQIARMPKAALAIYRRRVDPLAERWYREAVTARDEKLLQRVLDEMFCSSWGDDALLALGELALERADYTVARRCWEQLSPLVRDPAGRPMWLALHDIELEIHWPKIEARWRERSQAPVWLAYPDSDLALAEIRARLLLASIRAGDFRRAELELEAFRRFHPQATGRLGGQEGPYVAALESLLQAATQWPMQRRGADWPTFGGSQRRSSDVPKLGPVTGPAWLNSVSLAPAIVSRPMYGGATGVFGQAGGRVNKRPAAVAVRESQRPLCFFPVAANGVVFYSDAAQIHAVDLKTGRPAIAAGGILHRDELTEDRTTANINHFGGGRWPPPYEVIHGLPRHTLSIVEEVLYARVGRVTTSQANVQDGGALDRIVGLNLRRDGALAFRERAEDGWSFDGVPVGDGTRLWVAMRRSDVNPHAYVACYDAATGRMLWRTKIGAADTAAGSTGDVISHNLLTLVNDRIYFNTNLGLIAAIKAASGEICWLHRYERSGGITSPRQPPDVHNDRDPSPCLFDEGLVIVAPADTPLVFALDGDTGQTAWATDKLPDARHLLAVVRQNVIVSGNRLWALDLRSGELKFVWPESEHAGIRGMGRGLVAGDEIFWPTRQEIQVIHGVTGARSRPPIPLGSVSDCGANLAAADGRLIVAGYDKLMAFGPALPVPPNQKKPKSEPIATFKTAVSPTGRFSDESKSN